MDNEKIIHTTSNEQWCKECKCLVQSLDDHLAKVHGVFNKIGVQKGNLSSVRTAKRKADYKTSKTSDSKNLHGNNSFKKPMLQVARKSTAGRNSLIQNSNSFKVKVAGNETSPRTSSAVGFPLVEDVSKKEENNNDIKNSRDGKRKHVDDDDIEYEKKTLKCHECGIFVEKKGYIGHLMVHDEEKREMELLLKGSGTVTPTTSRKLKALDTPERLGKAEEKEDRRYLYLTPNDPRRKLPNAILQCSNCPKVLFFSTKTYNTHAEQCNRIFKKSMKGQ